jgi:hypothetical protein
MSFFEFEMQKYGINIKYDTLYDYKAIYGFTSFGKYIGRNGGKK